MDTQAVQGLHENGVVGRWPLTFWHSISMNTLVWCCIFHDLRRRIDAFREQNELPGGSASFKKAHLRAPEWLSP